jgi:inosine-uridine nucleoside N-ribohydrolase
MCLVLDCDPGAGVVGADVDDVLAIAYALGVVGTTAAVEVTTVAGNSEVELGVAAARTLLRHAGRPDVPVLRGAARPLVTDPGALRTWLDARAADWAGLWADVPPVDDVGPTVPTLAAVRLVELAREHAGELVVVATGPLTNIALACRLDPGFAGSLARLVVMGGNLGMPGMRWELNFGYDPEAVEVVLGSGAPLTLVPLDITSRTCWTPSEARALATGHGALGEWLGRSSLPWIEFVMATRKIDGCRLHDPLAVAVALDDSLAKTREFAIGVDLSEGPQRGTVIAWPVSATADTQRPAAGRTTHPVNVVSEVDYERFRREFNAALSRLAGTATAGVG